MAYIGAMGEKLCFVLFSVWPIKFGKIIVLFVIMYVVLHLNG